MTSEQIVLVKTSLVAEGLTVQTRRFKGVRQDVRPHTRDYAQTLAERINKRYVKASERMSILRAKIARNILENGTIARPKAVRKMAQKVTDLHATCVNLEQQAQAIIFK